MQKIHVILRRNDLDPAKAYGKVAVVLDIIFATSTIVTALRNGARAVVPAMDEEQARQFAYGRAADEIVLAGEYHADTLAGFHPYNPLAMSASLVSGKELIYATTNGTGALCGAQVCKYVYVGALLNARAVVGHLLRRFRDETILLVCSGTRGMFSLEDFYGAGYFAQLLLEHGGRERFALSDSAVAALHLSRNAAALDVLAESKVGRRMARRAMQADIRHAAVPDGCPIVAALTQGKVVRV